MNIDDEEDEEPLPASPPLLSPLRTSPHVLESSSNYDIPVTTTTTVGRPYKGPLSTYEVGEPSSVASALVFFVRYELNQLEHDFGILGSRVQSLTQGMGTRRTEIAEAYKEGIRARQRLDKLEVAKVDWYRLECELYSVRVQMYAIQQEMYWRGFEENRPTESIDVLATYGDDDLPDLTEPLLANRPYVPTVLSYLL
ncbi:hypothetical protein Tco_0646949 [Tanacetum coccineum]